MEDTLSYFFSAVFQGFAAILSLGSMFYLYYLKHFSEKLRTIELEMRSLYEGIGQGIVEPDIDSEKFLSQVRECVMNIRIVNTYPSQEYELKNEYKKYHYLENKNKIIRNELIGITSQIVLLLVLSIIALILVGFFWNFIYALCSFVLILSIYILNDVKRLIFTIIQIKI